MGLNKYQKGDFTSSTIAFYQKSIFNQVILINGIFSGSFLDNLELISFIKSWWQQKQFFLQKHNTILQRVISKCKNDKP